MRAWRISSKCASTQAFFFAQASHIHWQIERKIIAENTVILERKNHICFNGKNIILPVVSIIEFTNNKVSLFRDYFDALTFSNQYADTSQ